MPGELVEHAEAHAPWPQARQLQVILDSRLRDHIPLYFRLCIAWCAFSGPWRDQLGWNMDALMHSLKKGDALRVDFNLALEAEIDKHYPEFCEMLNMDAPNQTKMGSMEALKPN